MARFHLSGDPYFPNHGNKGWIEEEPKEDPEVLMEEDPEDQEEDDELDEEEDSDMESRIHNTPYAACAPTRRRNF